VCQKSDLAWITAISAVTFSSTFAHASIQWLVGPAGGIHGQDFCLLGSRSTSWATWRVLGKKAVLATFFGQSPPQALNPAHSRLLTARMKSCPCKTSTTICVAGTTRLQHFGFTG
jgi:hypothetical protein